MSVSDFPTPIIKRRDVDTIVEQQAIEVGMHPIVARVIASRPRPQDMSPERLLTPRLSDLSSPAGMADMDKAVARLVEAIKNKEVIALETDHDCDGQTSHAVLYEALVTHFNHPAAKVVSFIGHRLTEGYGLSESVANRILTSNPRPSVVITADNGSSDEPRIAQLKAEGIDVIVTDHHALPQQGPPTSAYACLNPTRDDCQYTDPLIAGCMVAWLFMCALRKALVEAKHLPEDAPKLADLLDFVAVGTVADCVSIARSQNNRAVIKYGLKLIAEGKRPCWRALLPNMPGGATSESLGFTVGPLLNSDGRLSDALGSVSLLLSETDEEAARWVKTLQTQNESRKKIQKKITQDAIEVAAQQVQAGKVSLCVYLSSGHSGVHGISASRLKDKFGRPTIILSPKQGQEGVITGSARGIDGFHVREALQLVADRAPDLLIAFGGHRGAAGLSLRLEHLNDFETLFEEAASAQLQAADVGPVIWTDGELPGHAFTTQFVDTLQTLEPYGREFDVPVFEVKGDILDIRVVGADGIHAQVTFESEGVIVRGIWFQMRQRREDPMPVQVGDFAHIVMSAKTNEYRSRKTFNPHIVFMQTET